MIHHHYALVSESSHVAQTDLTAMATSIMVLCNTRMLPLWEIAPISAQWYADKSQAPLGSWVALFTDQETQADALAWHDDPGGLPTVTIQVPTILGIAGAGILTGTTVSLSSALCHEVFESEIDQSCNTWVQMPNGNFIAMESADPVQGDSLIVHAAGVPVMMSNGVLPAYFDPNRSGPYDLLSRVAQPFGMTPGGYQIIFTPKYYADADGGVSFVWGEKVPTDVKVWRQREGARAQQRCQAMTLHK